MKEGKNGHKPTDLFEKFKAGTLTEAEKAYLESWYIQYAAQSGHEADPREMERRLKSIAGNLPKGRRASRVRRFLPYLTPAAAILLNFIGINYYQSRPAIANATDINPGGNKATLTLENGNTIELSGDKEGVLMRAGTLTYNDGSQLDNITSEKDVTETVRYLTITTPKGGKYAVVLDDGTKVWLNSASTLRYPATFAGKCREVEITGEAYFEIAQDHMRPFIAHCNEQEIIVLGTAFNVSAYDDDESVRTTLITGSVNIDPVDDKVQAVVLQPGEQATLSPSGIKTGQADTRVVTGWKEGLFRFNNTDLRSAMNQLSRWYNVTVEYQGQVPHTYFSGEIDRNSSLATVLAILKESGLNFRVERRRTAYTLVVMSPDELTK